ncbi:MAG: hypothetical protein DI537_23765 [Stutzerimonas stutzeri]|nr:MAG: hypothetical protein DI537_23765 [Stutzerimonas stutzeri]
MARVTGGKIHAARLRRLSSPSARREITKALYAAGQEIEIEAEISITSGSISGAGHVPSLPGEPPNRDTGLLDGDIISRIVSSDNPLVYVESNAPYAAALEFGTSKMAERPYMRPATAKKKGQAAALVRRAVQRQAR